MVVLEASRTVGLMIIYLHGWNRGFQRLRDWHGGLKSQYRRGRTDAPWETGRLRKTSTKFIEALFVTGILRIKASKRTFEPQTGKNSWSTMTWPSHEQGINIVFLNKKGAMRITQNETRVGAPMSQNTRFDILLFERSVKHVVVFEIEHRYEEGENQEKKESLVYIHAAR